MERKWLVCRELSYFTWNFPTVWTDHKNWESMSPSYVEPFEKLTMCNFVEKFETNVFPDSELPGRCRSLFRQYRLCLLSSSEPAAPSLPLSAFLFQSKRLIHKEEANSIMLPPSIFISIINNWPIIYDRNSKFILFSFFFFIKDQYFVL